MKNLYLLCFLFSGLSPFSDAFSASPFALQKMKGNNNRDFSAEWKRVDSLQRKGLTTSALKIVESLYAKAKKGNNTNDIIRCLIERMKLESYLDDDSFVQSISRMEKEAGEATFPTQSILYSVLAESYWFYYQNHRYQFFDRTETIQNANSDIRTWDLKKLLNKVKVNYERSLQLSNQQKMAPLAQFSQLLIKEKSSTVFRPTLYDFLAHRAVDFFMNEEVEVSQPINAFKLNSQDYFLPYSDFKKLKLTALDTSSMHLDALLILQQLINFHSLDNIPQALIDVDLKRLKFIKQHTTLQQGDSLFENALQNLEKEFAKSPFSSDVSSALANYYWEKSNQEIGSVNQGTQKSYKVKSKQKCDETIAKFPESDGAKICGYISSLLLDKALQISVEDAQVPNKPILFLLKYKNTKRVYFKIVLLPGNNEFDLDRGINAERRRALLKLEAKANWAINLPDNGDLEEHKVQLDIQPLDFGHYMLFAGTDSSFSDLAAGLGHVSFWVSSIAFINRQTLNGGYEGYVLNRYSGQPISNVSIQLWSEKYDYKERKYSFEKAEQYLTNDSGEYSIPSAKNNKNFYIEFTTASGDRYCSDYGFYQFNSQEGRHQEKQVQTYFFTDRKIYRPGQVIYFKGLTIAKIGKQQEVVANQSTEVVFYDANSQMIASQKVLSNEYGTFHGSFLIPNKLLNGQMSIGNGNGSGYFFVEEYKRPKFEVTFKPLTVAYKLGDTVSVSAKAVSFSGANIENAQVQFRIVRQSIFPVWWPFVRSIPHNSSVIEIALGKVVTNQDGEFNLKFRSETDIEGDASNSSYFSYTIYADVTDITGETQSAQTSINIGLTTLLIKADISEKIEKKEGNEFKISSTNLNGDYEATAGIFRVYRLTQPKGYYKERKWEKPDRFLMSKDDFSNLFPHDLYDDEDDKNKWKREIMVLEVPFNTDSTLGIKAGRVLLSDIENWLTGEYFWEAVALDKNDIEVKLSNYFSLFSIKQKVIPTTEVNYFSVLIDKGEPGDHAKVLIGTIEDNVQVHFEIEHQNKIVKSEWLVLTNEQKLIDVPIIENYRGNFVLHFSFILHNRMYSNNILINVPFTNKELDLVFESFRTKLNPGSIEKWKIKIKPKLGGQVPAEMAATMYDASLDAFSKNTWQLNLYDRYFAQLRWDENQSFKVNTVSAYGKDWNVYSVPIYRQYDQLNWFGFEGFSAWGNGRRGVMYSGPMSTSSIDLQQDKSANNPVSAEKGAGVMMKQQVDIEGDENLFKAKKSNSSNQSTNMAEAIKLRKNFNETAFFYPQMNTNSKGEIEISFQVPESLTKWKFLGMAHTKDLKIGLIEKEFITQKEMMINLNPPRFLRSGDEITLSAKLDNLTTETLFGEVQLQIFDALTMKDVSKEFQLSIPSNIYEVKGNSSKKVSWNLKVPKEFEVVVLRTHVKSKNFSDGEELTVPVLSNRTLITESLPISTKGAEEKRYSFDKLKSQNNQSSSLANYKVTLEFTTNPAWYAIQSLPYLMDSPSENSEQLFTRFYSNSIAQHIANSSPRIKAVFNQWKESSTDIKRETLLSNLEKNQEIKSILLTETPWVMQAQNETERKQRMGWLFDFNNIGEALNQSLSKLKEIQNSNGGWPWIAGMPDDEFITQHIVAGLGHLDRLGIKEVKEGDCRSMIEAALIYLDNRMQEDYEQIVRQSKGRLDGNHLSYLIIHYLYTRSFFLEFDFTKKNKEAFNFFQSQAQKYWLNNSRNMQGMLSLALHRFGSKSVAGDIINSLKENALHSEELGMYWKENNQGYFWYEAPIEMQSLLIEAFSEVSNDQVAVEEMKLWLLKHKQTNDWKTTKATSAACYALLLKGENWLRTTPGIEITLGKQKISSEKFDSADLEAGSGYFKQSWHNNEIENDMGNILIKPLKVNEESKQPMWGAVYWQYFEELDKVNSSKGNLNIEKKFFIEKNTDYGLQLIPVDTVTALHVGDKIKVRIEIRVDRAMEYVHLKDMRGSGFEPLNVISGYKFQDGLGYYESTKDASTNFFFSQLNKGVYVFEYPLVISQSGNFSSGIATIQCQYAPEFTSHSEGLRLTVGK